MNKEIDNVITEWIQLAEVIINTEGEVGDRSGDPLLVKSVKSFLETFPIQCLYVDILILNDIGLVVENPRTIQAIGINN